MQAMVIIMRRLGLRCNLEDENLAQYIIHLIRNVLGIEPCIRIRESTCEIRSGQKKAVNFFLIMASQMARKLGQSICQSAYFLLKNRTTQTG